MRLARNSVKLLHLALAFALLSVGAFAGTVTVNPATTIGTVGDTFYCVNNHGFIGSNNTQSDINDDGTLDGCSDNVTAEDRTKFTSMGAGMVRGDTAISDNSVSLGNWNNISCSNYADVDTKVSNVRDFSAPLGIDTYWTFWPVPTWLSDNNSVCASNRKECNPYNYSVYVTVAEGFLNLTGSNNASNRVSWQNEADLSQFAYPDITDSNTTRIDLAVAMQSNATREALARPNTFKPDICLGGLSNLDDTPSRNMMKALIGNLTNGTDLLVDCIEWHSYPWNLWDPQEEQHFADDVNYVYSLTDALGISRSSFYMIVGETNVYNGSWQRSATIPERADVGAGLLLSAALNLAPGNLSMCWFQSKDTAWQNGTHHEGHSASNDRMMSAWADSQHENKTYSGYRVYANMSQAHPAGKVVINSTDNDANLYTLASGNTTNMIVTVINTANSTSSSTTLAVTNYNITAAGNTFSATNYSITLGVATLGTLAPYETLYVNLTTTASPGQNCPTSGVIVVKRSTAYYAEDPTCSVTLGSDTVPKGVCTSGGCS